jgi:hypothetical protein
MTMNATAVYRKPTIDEFKQYARIECSELIATLIAARIFAEVERERVNSYVEPIFAQYDFRPSAEWLTRRGGMADAPLTRKDLYLTDLDAPAYLEYCERVKDAHAANGWTGDRDFCPALVAESAVNDAENAVLVSLGRMMNAPFEKLYGEKREHALKLATDLPFSHW